MKKWYFIGGEIIIWLIFTALVFGAVSDSDLLTEVKKLQDEAAVIGKQIEAEQNKWLESKPRKDYDAKVKVLADEFNKTPEAQAYSARMQALLAKRQELVNKLLQSLEKK